MRFPLFLLVATLLPEILPAQPTLLPGETEASPGPADPANGWVPVSPPPVEPTVLMGRWNDLYAGTRRGIFRSRDKAKTWVQVADMGEVKWIEYLDTVFYAGASGALWRSKDDGDTWHKVLEVGAPVEGIALLDERLFAGVRGFGMYRAMAEDGTWKPAPASPENRIMQAVVATDSVLLVGGPWGVYRSVDLSRHWVLPEAGLREPILELGVAKGGAVFALSEHGVVHRSGDGGITWTLEQAGLDTVEVRDLHVYARLPFVMGRGGVYRLKEGMGWGRIPGLEGEVLTHLTFVNGDLYAGAADRLFRKQNAYFARTVR
jgi:photosystem II stability/assembly factor-like uncharacterized protein